MVSSYQFIVSIIICVYDWNNVDLDIGCRPIISVAKLIKLWFRESIFFLQMCPVITSKIEVLCFNRI